MPIYPAKVHSTYNTSVMDDTKNRQGKPWEAGTLRIPHSGEALWSVSPPYDSMHNTALHVWWDSKGAQFFDGAKWRSIKEYYVWLTAEKNKELYDQPIKLDPKTF